MNVSTTETVNNESDWRKISIYKDGSGKAGDFYDAALKTMREREDVLRVNALFIEANKQILAGVYWTVGYLDPEIKISWGTYRGEKAEPADIAALWPGAEWKRARQKYGERLTYDWCAEVDGVTIRIECAETEKPRPRLSEGIINLQGSQKG